MLPIAAMVLLVLLCMCTMILLLAKCGLSSSYYMFLQHHFPIPVQYIVFLYLCSCNLLAFFSHLFFLWL